MTYSVTYLLATLLLVTPYSSTFGIAQISDDVTKPKTTENGGKQLAENSKQISDDICTVNGRSAVICGMCAEIFHQMMSPEVEKQDDGNNMATAECCESGDVYDICAKTLKELMEGQDDGQNWIEPVEQQETDESSYLSDNEGFSEEDDAISDDVMDSEDKRAYNPFLGKRAMNPFLGKRANPFLGKRMNPFLGKRPAMNPFLGKRAMNPFLGKRPAMNPFLGKRPALNPFLGKRPAMNPFLGKRAMNPFLGRRAMNPFLGKRAMNPFLGKRGNPFLG